MHCSYTELSAQRLAMAKPAPRSLAKSWTAAFRHLSMTRSPTGSICSVKSRTGTCTRL